MRILHTADWHLGARLVERDRLPEHAAFLDWLIETLRSEKSTRCSSAAMSLMPRIRRRMPSRSTSTS
jgi:hypothetical protein